MPKAPQTRSGRRPILSTPQNDNGVEHTFTRLKTSEIKKAFLMAPVDCRKGVE
jgi:hypothetical protein